MKTHQKIILTILFAIVSCFPIAAGTKIVSGSLSAISEAEYIPVIANWSKAVYERKGRLVDFLDRSYRDPEWESKSLGHFFQAVNKETGKYGLRLVHEKECSDYKLWFEIHTYKIDDEGDIKGEILLKSNDSLSPLAIISFSSDEADDDDEIAFADQFESIGESLAGKLKSVLKKSYSARKK